MFTVSLNEVNSALGFVEVIKLVSDNKNLEEVLVKIKDEKLSIQEEANKLASVQKEIQILKADLAASKDELDRLASSVKSDKEKLELEKKYLADNLESVQVTVKELDERLFFLVERETRAGEREKELSLKEATVQLATESLAKERSEVLLLKDELETKLKALKGVLG